MAVKPILFSTTMVRAILEGRKTQTRRVVTVHWHKGKRTTPYEPRYVEYDGRLLYQDAYGEYHPMENVCPYQPGTVLWVQETWKIDTLFDGDMLIEYKADDSRQRVRFSPERFEKFKKFSLKNGWQSPYFMPKEAARLFLAVKDVRVERLQDITEDDARLEGIELNFATAREAFAALWDSINGKKYPWESSPWVWVISFERTEKPEAIP